MEENNAINQFDPSRARDDLMRMLSDLSVDALELVWRPIVYAYYLTDDNNPNAISDEDANSFELIGAAVHGSSEFVSRLNGWMRALQSVEQENAGAKL